MAMARAAEAMAEFPTGTGRQLQGKEHFELRDFEKHFGGLIRNCHFHYFNTETNPSLPEISVQRFPMARGSSDVLPYIL